MYLFATYYCRFACLIPQRNISVLLVAISHEIDVAQKKINTLKHQRRHMRLTACPGKAQYASDEVRDMNEVRAAFTLFAEELDTVDGGTKADERSCAE
uniref:Integrase n=1 Tax=Ascaris lumbricoides TaxID=6252 RepID=A0A0M3IIX3_ASCLU